jgi:hypothetical protein
MTTISQVVHKLERLEEQMGARDLPQLQITIDFVESHEACPTGRIKRVRWLGGEKISEEKIHVDPATLLGR